MRKIIPAIVVCAFLPSGGHAKFAPASLGDAIGFSNLIFIGTVFEKNERPLVRDSFNSWGVLEISVDSVICGGFYPEEGWRNGRVEVLYQINPIERPLFGVGEKYVFFYRTTYGGPTLAPSFYGAVPVANDEIDARIFSDIDRTMHISDFNDLIDCSKINSKESGFR